MSRTDPIEFFRDSENFKKEQQVRKHVRNLILENANLEMFQRIKAFNFVMRLDELKSNFHRSKSSGSCWEQLNNTN
jgi:transcription elongation factor GreA-like protein